MPINEIADIIDIPRGKIRIKENLKVLGKLAGGHYDPIFDIISITKEAVNYWVATFMLMVHELRHLQQRRTVLSSYGFIGAMAVGSSIYGMHFLMPRDLLIGALFPVLCIISLYQIHEFLEAQARRFEHMHDVDILIILTGIEYSLLVHTLNVGKDRVHENLAHLSEEMQNRAPDLLGFELNSAKAKGPESL
ncbi:MAG: hypothetical protein ACXADD_16225 [Candidatus Thorarchaeota archaeon]|jgi:hypothetical protein